MPQPVVKLYGDWWRARRITTNLPHKLTVATGAALLEEAEAVARRIKNNIYAQNYGHVPLADATVARKAEEGADPRTLIETGKYVESIEAIPLSKTVVGVGTNDPELVPVGLAHEYGSPDHNLPARPVFRVELERMRIGRLLTIRAAVAKVLSGV